MIEQSESGAHSLVAQPAVDYPLSHARMLRMLARLAWGTAAAIDGYWLVAAPAGDWRMTGIDTDGIDLRAGGRVARVAFDAPVTDPVGARNGLIALVARAREEKG